SKHKPGYDIKKDRQGHYQKKSSADMIGDPTCWTDESFQVCCCRV
ncbi:unnamed protein product, partial [marine sediment metagenome]